MVWQRGRVAVIAGATVVALGGLPVAAHATPSPCDWPLYQHDAGRRAAAGCTSISPSNVATLVPRWFDRTERPVTASPIVVGGTVFVGDWGGVFHAIDAATGHEHWQFDINRSDNNGTTSYVDRHTVSYGGFVSSAAYRDGIVYVGGGGTVYALDASTGRQVWALDTDPAHPTSKVEVESSPVVADTAAGPLVLVGDDVNESRGAVNTGLVAIDGRTGALRWEFAPELFTRGDPGAAHLTVQPAALDGHGCGDVWSSPSLAHVLAGVTLAVFTTGNCSDPAGMPGGSLSYEAVWAVDAQSGTFRWVWSELGSTAATTYGGDDDFGAAPVVTAAGGVETVLLSGKSGFVYSLRATDGTPSTGWDGNGRQVAQPGQSGPFAGAVGGFIGSAALGAAGTATALFGGSAIPTPFAGDGPPTGAPDATLLTGGDPARIGSLHAVDVATGRVLWHQPLATPTYAAVTYANGVVFSPSTTSFAEEAYDAATGAPLWRAPLAAAPSSAAAVVGPDVFFGAGTSIRYVNPGAPLPSSDAPPQVVGVWSYGLP